MKRFSKKATFFSLVGLAAALSACHNETAAPPETSSLGNPGQGTPSVRVEQPTGSSLSISCVLGCCNKKKANPILPN
jgi:hypothetical protein